MSERKQSVKVWDLWVRMTHWTVALGVFANLMLTEEGSDVHQYVGYALVILVVLRLIWGIIGSQYARFSSFFPTPKRLLKHVQQMKQGDFGKTELGHNPFGALMMFALWGAILIAGVTGFLITTDKFYADYTLGKIHEYSAESLYFLVPIHVLSAIVMSVLQKQNLVKAMITGKKQI